MNSTRRDFLAAGLAAVGTTALLDSTKAEDADTIECLDYGRSFICNTSTVNAVRFWVESRTLLFDDKRFEPPVDSVRLAFAVFNAPHFCDFVIEQPTAVIRDEQEVCQVYHYSNPVSFPAKNRVLSVAGTS